MNDLIVNALLSTVNQTEGEKMTINDYLILAAIIIIPIVAVVIAQWFQIVLKSARIKYKFLKH